MSSSSVVEERLSKEDNCFLMDSKDVLISETARGEEYENSGRYNWTVLILSLDNLCVCDSNQLDSSRGSTVI